jgi:hypothetical protein
LLMLFPSNTSSTQPKRCICKDLLTQELLTGKRAKFSLSSKTDTQLRN